jgi:hypothetical protein
MTHFVRVENGEVKDVWDTAPEEGVGHNGWRNAVEVRPSITPNRQRYTSHRFDLNTDPVQIIWDTCDITVDERKISMKNKFKQEFRQVVNDQLEQQLSADSNQQLDVSIVEAARQTMLTKEAAVDAATTHDELDALS